VALFVGAGARMIGADFVEFGGSPKAGHATQPRCYMANALTDQTCLPVSVRLF
jgi:hypothetical protein